MAAKFGQWFENVSKFFDHAAHNGSIIEDFFLSAEKNGDYYVGVRKVITNIFEL